jgi:putative ABC transport system permease protein
MGKLVLVGRLAVRDLRRRPAQALLLALVLTAALGTLTLGLILHGVTNKPYDQTRAATAGPDVVASSVGYGSVSYGSVSHGSVSHGSANHGGTAGPSASALRQFDALADAPGVVAYSGPFPVAWPVLRANGISADVMAEGRAETTAAVDQPKVVAGRWVRPGGVVLERAFADALGVRVGQHVTLAGHPFLVDGIAVTAAVPVYSQVCFYGGCSGPPGQRRSFDTGLVWLTEPAARALATRANPVTYYLNLRLANPGAAAAFVAAHQPPPQTGPAALTSWQSLRSAAATLVSQEQQVLGPASWLLCLLAMASVAVVAGGRMAEQERRVGMLKAAGGGPALTVAVLLAEHLAVAVAAAIAGLAAGYFTSPLLASPGASLVGSPGTAPLGWSTVLIVVTAAIVVTGASTAWPAVRAARVSTVAALAEQVRPPRRSAWLIQLSARLPVPILLGLRLVTRRPRRALLTFASCAVTATAIVAVLVFHASVRAAGGFVGAPDPGHLRVSEVLLVVTVAMVVLAAVDAVVTSWATVLDTRRFSAVVRSLGATPRQSAAGLSAAQLLPALIGGIIGIPAGEVLYAVVQHGGRQASPSPWWLLAMVAGILLAVGGLTAIPARFGAQRPVSEALAAEAT